VLSTREHDVLQNMVEGLDYKQIADKLFISPATVRTHISNIYKKLHVTSKAQAIKLAYKNKWL
jgi:DNA-binding NarL/FixJ family response regulator